MNNIPQSPLWLIRFHQSLCLPDLLSSKKHLISIYRQPDPKDLEISVFGASNKNGAAPAFAVSQDHVFSNPYIRASIPGKYRIEARNSSGNSTLLDHADCDITTLPYCKYFYPPSAKADVDSLNLQGAIYDAAVAYHYPASDLTKIADGAASIYSRILRDNPTKARVQATELRSSSRELWTSMGQSPQLARTQLQLLTAPDFPDELLGAVDKYEADNPGVRITAGQTFKPGAPTFAITYQRFSVHGGGVGSLAGSLGSIGPLVGGGSSLPSIAFLPIGVNALVPIYNLPGVEGEIVLTPEILGGAYLGRIKNWDDAAILRVNPGVSMPNMPIVVVHRTDSSESTSVWTDYLSKVSEDWARQVGTRDSVDWPTGIGAARNEGVESVVRERPGSLGYVDFGYALQRGLHYAEVENRAGNFVRADAQNVAAAAEGLKLTFEEIPSIVNSTAPNAYPIAGIVCVLADFSQREGTQAKSILDFVKWLNDWTIKPPGWYTALPPDVLQATRNEVDKLYK
jgi:phosphate transport system substrate-binding protein